MCQCVKNTNFIEVEGVRDEDNAVPLRVRRTYRVVFGVDYAKQFPFVAVTAETERITKNGASKLHY